MKRSCIALIAVLIIAFIFWTPRIILAVGSKTAICFEEDDVFVGYSAINFGLSGEITVSSWVKWSKNPNQQGSNSENQWAVIVSNSSYKDGEDGQFWLQHDRNNKHFEFVVNTDCKHFAISKTAPDSGLWYHITGVYNKNLLPRERLKIYVNGIDDTKFSSEDISGNIKNFNKSYLLKIGRGSYSDAIRLFSGDIDEVAIWDRALTTEQIRELMCNGPTGEEEGISGYWNFDEGECDVVFDKTFHHRDGVVFFENGKAERGGEKTLEDFDKHWDLGQWIKHTIIITKGRGLGQEKVIVSNTSNTLTVSEEWEIEPDFTSKYAISSKDKWVFSEAPIGDSSTYKYVDEWGGEELVLSHEDGDSVIIRSVNGNPGGIQIYRVDEAPMNNNPPDGWSKLDPLRHWGVLLIGGEEPSYTITYNYEGHPGIFVERDLGLSRRHSIYSPWENTGAILDTVNNTLTSIGETGTEFILMDHYGNNTLPVTITNFSAYVVNGAISLNWRTESEYSNTVYCLYRSNSDIEEYECIAQIPGNGASSTYRTYSYEDNDVISGNIYNYKLIEVSEVSSGNEHGPIKIKYSINKSEKVEMLGYNFPNPFSFGTSFEYRLFKASNICLSIYDISGRLVKNIVSSYQQPGRRIVAWNGIDSKGNEVPEGLYFAVLKSDSEIVAAQKMIRIK